MTITINKPTLAEAKAAMVDAERKRRAKVKLAEIAAGKRAAGACGSRTASKRRPSCPTRGRKVSLVVY